MNSPTLVGYAGLAALALRYLVAAIEARNDWTPEQKRRIPVVLVALGALATAAAHLAGQPLGDALVLGGGAPGAVLVNELINGMKRPPPNATALILAAFATCLLTACPLGPAGRAAVVTATAIRTTDAACAAFLGVDVDASVAEAVKACAPVPDAVACFNRKVAARESAIKACRGYGVVRAKGGDVAALVEDVTRALSEAR